MPSAQPVYRPRDAEHTVLYGVVREHLDAFLRAAEAGQESRGLPPFIEREFRQFLTCGVLAHGFVRLRCEGCAREHLVPFSCKGRGFCPSCGGRRMTERAAHLIDAVVPWVPVRQWVLTLPYRLHYLLAWDHRLSRAVLGVYARALLGLYVSFYEAAGRVNAWLCPSGSLMICSLHCGAVPVGPVSRGSVSLLFALIKGEPIEWRARRRRRGFERWGRHLRGGPATAAKATFALTHPSNLRETGAHIIRTSATRSHSHGGCRRRTRMPNALGLEHAATIADPAVIEQILTHLGLSSGPGAPGPAPPAGTAVVANS